ncbi:hypothetical protein EDC01DRAFT_299075 [Geopyxis carbonaria]|nr:hypothetical protein EDC01DRAFT_299075 [Geopyxis carbonaria]
MKYLSILAITLCSVGALAAPAEDVPDLEKRANTRKVLASLGAQNCIIQRPASCNWGPGPANEYRAKHQFGGNENIKLDCYLRRTNGAASDNVYWDWVPKWGCYVNESHFKEGCVCKTARIFGNRDMLISAQRKSRPSARGARTKLEYGDSLLSTN